MQVKTAFSETLAFEDARLASELFGPLNAHIELIADASGAELETRGTELTVTDARPERRGLVLNLFTQGYGLLRSGREIRGEDLLQGYEELLRDPRADIGRLFRDAAAIVSPRKTILARNTAQRRYMELLRAHELVFATGPAGTGKTYLAVAMALSMLAAKRVKKIVLTRPAVEAGERLGFLPGDMEDKVNPYLRPLYDALGDMLGMQSFAQKQEAGIIEVAPLAFMRGRTLNDAFLILDEAQNTTREQMKMFLTRMGFGSRAVITGDVTQIDLPPVNRAFLREGEEAGETRSGLVHALRVLNGVRGIGFHCFQSCDVVRHPLVGRIVDAYDSHEKE
ncbi:PhoH family protein [uncultured Mailhella sp.]|uniref:PhoH family protein n=1 Tax=uncultured Mailhella sp. TaxID=1981031 RepID=UPI002603F5D3|nr:PhoH family protein [uncultured Mailhella sp.]